MNAPAGAQGKPAKRRREGDGSERPPIQEPQSQLGTPFLPGRETRTIPPRLVEFLPRAGKSAVVSLLKRGLPPPAAEDIVQDVVYAAVYQGIDPPSFRSLTRWMHVAAHNRATTWLRTSERNAARHGAVDELEALLAAEDPASRVEQRAMLRAVAIEFDKLRPADKEIIRAALNDPRPGRTKRERDRFALRLHRARLRLQVRLRNWLVLVAVRLRVDDFVTGAQQIAPLAAAIGVAGASAILGVGATSASAATTVAVPGAGAVEPSVAFRTVEGPAPPAVVLSATGPGRHIHEHITTTTITRTRAADAPAPVVPYQHADVRASDGAGLEAGTKEIPPNAPLLCLTNIPVAGTNCVRHPLRK